MPLSNNADFLNFDLQAGFAEIDFGII